MGQRPALLRGWVDSSLGRFLTPTPTHLKSPISKSEGQRCIFSLKRRPPESPCPLCPQRFSFPASHYSPVPQDAKIKCNALSLGNNNHKRGNFQKIKQQRVKQKLCVRRMGSDPRKCQGLDQLQRTRILKARNRQLGLSTGTRAGGGAQTAQATSTTASGPSPKGRCNGGVRGDAVLSPRLVLCGGESTPVLINSGQRIRSKVESATPSLPLWQLS